MYESRDGIFEERVTHVEHFTDGLFSFRITRPQSFRFRSGEFAMIGLPNAAKPVFRAYSIASPAWGEELEFYSIKVPGGPLTEHLKRIEQGDTVLLKKKATGTLVIDTLLPGRRLFLFSTGTGIAPFASIIRDPETYEKYDQIVLTQTCRIEPELAYGRGVVARTRTDPLVAELVAEDRLRFVTSLTREPHSITGRITTLIETGELLDALGIREISAADDRAMICGSLEMIKDTRRVLETSGFGEGSNARPGTFVVERAFVD
ncbi:MAG: ferredoxin--NADP reductase [Pseudomonadota bacterium]